VGTFSCAPGFEKVAHHELGHTAFNLADEDEYLQGCRRETDQDNYPGSKPAEANVTVKNDPAKLKWSDLVAVSMPVPTTQNPNYTQCDSQASPVPVGIVALFEGAHHYHCGVFRPKFKCKMRALDDPFCAFR